MASVSLTVGDLAVSLRISSSRMESLQTGVSSILTRHLATATALVERYAPDAPAAILNEAATRVAGFLYDRPPEASTRGISPLLHSGAQALLSSWRNPGLGAQAEATPSGSTAATGDPVQVADWAEQDNTDQIPADKLGNVPGGSYTLPAATASVRGGVLGITNAILDAGISTGVFGWAISHVKRAINAIVPEWARIGHGARVPLAKLPQFPNESEAADAANINAHTWNPLRVHTAIDSTVHDWARDAATQIPANKLDNAPSAGGGTSVDVKHMGGLSASGVTGEQFIAVFPALTLTEGQQVVAIANATISAPSGSGGNIDIFRGATHAVTAQSSEFVTRGDGFADGQATAFGTDTPGAGDHIYQARIGRVGSSAVDFRNVSLTLLVIG